MGNDGQEVFDGLPVEIYDGKFSGSFDMDTLLAKGISMDDEITFIVSGHVSAVAHAQTKNGEIKRTNTFKVTSAHPIQPQKAQTIMSELSPFSLATASGYLDKNAAEKIVAQSKAQPDWSTAETAPLFSDEEEDRPFPKFGDDEAEDEDDDEPAFSPGTHSGDHEVLGRITYKDPILAKMMGDLS